METFVKFKKQPFAYRWIDLLRAQLCSVHCREILLSDLVSFKVLKGFCIYESSQDHEFAQLAMNQLILLRSDVQMGSIQITIYVYC